MANRLNNKTAEMEYLLGNLSSEEIARVEHDFFTDDGKFQELELAEDDLIDAYVRGELSDAEERQFRTKLLIIPRIVERVNFAVALAERTPKPVPPTVVPEPEPVTPKPRWWASLFGPRFRPALAACMGVLVVGGLFLLTLWLVLQRRSDELAAERAAVQRQKENLDRQATELQARSEQQSAEVKKQLDQIAADRKLLEERLQQAERDTSFVGSVLPFLLTPGGSRSTDAGGSDLKLGPSDSTVKLRVVLERANYRSYNVVVTAVGDEQVVAAGKKLRPQKTRDGSVVTLLVPARRLPPGDYIVEVAGVTSSGEGEPVGGGYKFRVLKKPK